MKVRELFAKLGFKVDDTGAKEFDDRMEGLKKRLVAVGAAASAAALALGAMVKSAVDQADAIDKASMATGVDAEALQRLAYAADLSGVSFEQLKTGVQIFAKNARDASNGVGEFAREFAAAGIATKGAGGQMRPVEELLGDVADKLSALPDGAEKTGLAMRLLGRSGALMIPLMNEGRAGIAAMGAELEQLGGIISREQIDASVKFNDSLSTLQYAFRGLGIAIAGPALEPLNRLTKAMIEWVKTNRAVIKQRIDQAFEKVGAAFDMARDRIAPLLDAASWAIDKLGGLRMVAILTAVAIGAQLAGALGSAALVFVAYVARLKTVAFWQGLVAAGPVAWGVALLAVGLILDEVITAFRGGDTLIGDLFKKFAKAPEKEEFWMITFGRAFWATWGDIAVEVPKSLTWWKAKIAEFLSWMIDKVATANAAVGDAVKGAARGAARIGFGSIMPAGAADWAAESIFGGGPKSVQPSAPTPTAPPAGGARSVSTTFAPVVNVTAQTGASADEIAGHVNERLQSFRDDWMRELGDDVTWAPEG